MKSVKAFLLVMAVGASALAIGTNDAILGQGDTFGCDSFSRDAKVACMPNVTSSYRDTVSFPSQPALILNAYQVVECRSLGADRDVICAAQAPIPPWGPGPSYPPPAPGQPLPQPIETRRAFAMPDLFCLQNLPPVANADDMVSNAFLPNIKLVDRCESSRDRGQIRQMESRGFRCTEDTLATNQSDSACVANLLEKITNKSTIKGSHRRRLETVFCASKTFNCVR